MKQGILDVKFSKEEEISFYQDMELVGEEDDDSELTATVDLEFTQNEYLNGEQPAIIQIGICIFEDSTGGLLDCFSMVANPGQIPDRFISDLTGISREQVEKALPLKEVLEEMVKFLSKHQLGREIWEWGFGDWKRIREACIKLKVDFPKKIVGVDLKKMLIPFKSVKHLKKKGGLEVAMKELGLSFLGRPHDALWDSYNTGILYLYIANLINLGFRAMDENKIKVKDRLKEYQKGNVLVAKNANCNTIPVVPVRESDYPERKVKKD